MSGSYGRAPLTDYFNFAYRHHHGHRGDGNIACEFGALRLRVLWPDGPGSPGEDPNNHAIVLLASYGQVDALFTADAESDVTGHLHVPPVGCP